MGNKTTDLPNNERDVLQSLATVLERHKHEFEDPRSRARIDALLQEARSLEVAHTADATGADLARRNAAVRRLARELGKLWRQHVRDTSLTPFNTYAEETYRD